MKNLAILLLFVALMGIAYELWLMPHNKTQHIEIAGPFGIEHLALDQPQTIVVRGVVGNVHTQILDGKVRVTHADCPDRLCQKTGSISKAPQRIVCLPNKVVIKIVGTSEVDTIVN